MSALVKTLLSVGIVVVAIPGLIIEPGPLSEVAAIGAILAIWGYGDVLTGGGS